MAGRRATHEGLDNDHATAAAGAGTQQHALFILRCSFGRIGLFGAGRHSEQLARQCDVVGAGGLLMADFVAEVI
jgi:hypothetical protein